MTPPPGPAPGTAQDAVAAWVEENLTYEHFRDWSDEDFAKALIAAFPALAAPSGPQAAAGEVAQLRANLAATDDWLRTVDAERKAEKAALVTALDETAKTLAQVVTAAEALHADGLPMVQPRAVIQRAHDAIRAADPVRNYPAPPAGVPADRPWNAQPTDNGWWRHRDDESRCDLYITNRARPDADNYWWCTDHQQHVEWVPADRARDEDDGRLRRMREILDAASECGDGATAELVHDLRAALDAQ